MTTINDKEIYELRLAEVVGDRDTVGNEYERGQFNPFLYAFARGVPMVEGHAIRDQLEMHGRYMDLDLFPGVILLARGGRA